MDCGGAGKQRDREHACACVFACVCVGVHRCVLVRACVFSDVCVYVFMFS